MKKKYSALLNFALAACVATALVGCSDDSSFTGPGASNQNQPMLAMLQGFVMDSNLVPIEGATIRTQGQTATSDAGGMYTFRNLYVTTTTSVDHGGDDGICITADVQPPNATYLSTKVSYCPQAEIDSLQDALEEDEIDEGNKSLTNPLVTFIQGYIAEADPAILPKLNTTVAGTLRHCSTGGTVNANVVLDFQNVHVEYSGWWGSTYIVDASADPMYTDTAVAGKFSIPGVPDDSTFDLFVPGYDVQSVAYESCGNDYGSAEDGWCVTTTNEGHVVDLGTVSVCPRTSSDTIKPCVKSTDKLITQNSDRGNFQVDFDPVADGFVVHFTEAMNVGAIEASDVKVHYEIISTGMEGYLTVDSVEMSADGMTMTLKTSDALPEARTRVDLWLPRGDFLDEAGNELSTSCDLVGYDAQSQDHGDYKFFDLYYKTYGDTSVASGTLELTGQVCPGPYDAGRPDLHAQYPRIFADNGTPPNSDGEFNVLNAADAWTAPRLQALADAIETTEADSYIINGTARVEFVPPAVGDYDADYFGKKDAVSGMRSQMDVNIDYIGSVGDAMAQVVVSSGSDNVVVGGCVQFTIEDIYGTPVQVTDCEDMILTDCLAPTTVLNFAYNSCGHLGYDATVWTPSGSPFHSEDDALGYDMPYAGHMCSTGDVDTIAYGDGGENSDPGTELFHNPTLNITCRLLKDPDGLPDLDIANSGSKDQGIDFYRLYDGVNGNTATDGSTDTLQYDAEDHLYDATEFAAWGAFPDTVGVAFSENIKKKDALVMPVLSDSDSDGTASISTWSIRNNVDIQDDGWPTDNNPDLFSYTGPAEADLAMVTFSDVIALANDYHGETVDFTAAVLDMNDVAADNADVTINDLLPPFVAKASWDGDLVIEFNEDISVSMSEPGCNVVLRSASGGDFQSFALADAVATGNTLTWEAVAIPDRSDIFDMGSWAESVYGTGSSSLPHARLETGCVADTRGNTWNWVDDDFRNPVGGQQCRVPEFLAIDILGEFDDSKTAPAFACGSDTDVVMSTTTTHPVDYVSTYGCNPNILNNAAMIACMEPLIEFNANPLPDSGITLSGLTINASRTSAVFTLDNSGPVIFADGDMIDIIGQVGAGNGVYVSIYEVTPNQLPQFQLNCAP